MGDAANTELTKRFVAEFGKELCRAYYIPYEEKMPARFFVDIHYYEGTGMAHFFVSWRDLRKDGGLICLMDPDPIYNPENDEKLNALLIASRLGLAAGSKEDAPKIHKIEERLRKLEG